MVICGLVPQPVMRGVGSVLKFPQDSRGMPISVINYVNQVLHKNGHAKMSAILAQANFLACLALDMGIPPQTLELNLNA